MKIYPIMTHTNHSLVGAGKAAAHQGAIQVMVFDNAEFGAIRIVTDEQGEPWFCGKDTCAALGYKQPHVVVHQHVRPHDMTKHHVSTPVICQGKNTGKTKRVEMFFVNESGFYALVLGSKLDTAQKFRHWVISVVPPQIRKTGGFVPVHEGDTAEDIRRRSELVLKATLEQKDACIAQQKAMLAEQGETIARLGKVIIEKDRLLARQGKIITQQEGEIDRLAPKALYADNVLDSISCYTTTQIAKELGMTAQELNRLLCAKRIQYYQSGQYMLYAEYAHMGLAKSRTHYDLFVGPDIIRTRMYLVWTERGRKFLHDNFMMYQV